MTDEFTSSLKGELNMRDDEERENLSDLMITSKIANVGINEPELNHSMSQF